MNSKTLDRFNRLLSSKKFEFGCRTSWILSSGEHKFKCSYNVYNNSSSVNCIYLKPNIDHERIHLYFDISNGVRIWCITMTPNRTQLLINLLINATYLVDD